MTVIQFRKDPPKSAVPRPRVDEGSIALGIFAFVVSFLALFGGIVFVRDIIALIHPVINACLK